MQTRVQPARIRGETREPDDLFSGSLNSASVPIICFKLVPITFVLNKQVVITVESIDERPPTISITTLTSSGEAEVNADAPIGTFIAFVAATSRLGAKNPSKTIVFSDQ